MNERICFFAVKSKKAKKKSFVRFFEECTVRQYAHGFIWHSHFSKKWDIRILQKPPFDHFFLASQNVRVRVKPLTKQQECPLQIFRPTDGPALE